MKQRARTRRRARIGLCPHGGRASVVDGDSGGCGFRAGPSWIPGVRRARRLRQGSPRARGGLGQGPSGWARRSADRAARRGAGVGPCPTPTTALSTPPPATRARSFAASTRTRPPGPWPTTPTRRPWRWRPGRRQGRCRHRPERPGGRRDRPRASGRPSRSQGAVHLGPRHRREGQPLRRHRARRASSGSDPATASGRSSARHQAAHLLCVAPGPDGAVYAGSDGEGLIYRVARDGKASVVYDAPQARSALCFGPRRLHSTPARPPRRGGGGAESCGSLFSCATTVESRASDRCDARHRGTDRGGQSGRQSRAVRHPRRGSRRPGRRRPGPRQPGARPLPGRSRPGITPSTGSIPTASPARSSGSRR